MPLIQVRGEDTVAKKIFPLLVEFFPFTIIGELGGEDGFDIFWVDGEDATDPAGSRLDGPTVMVTEVGLPAFEVPVVNGLVYGSYNHVNA